MLFVFSERSYHVHDFAVAVGKGDDVWWSRKASKEKIVQGNVTYNRCILMTETVTDLLYMDLQGATKRKAKGRNFPYIYKH